MNDFIFFLITIFEAVGFGIGAILLLRIASPLLEKYFQRNKESKFVRFIFSTLGLGQYESLSKKQKIEKAYDNFSNSTNNIFANFEKEVARILKESQSAIENEEESIKNLERTKEELSEQLAELENNNNVKILRMIEHMEKKGKGRDYSLFFAGISVSIILEALKYLFDK